jgi:GT2 family glycosyltransferase
MEITPLASVIILSWNGLNFIEACLEAVLSQTYLNIEFIVVDNASTDGTPELVAEKFPAIQLIKNERNLGFAAGMNVGLTQAKGDFLILLNQDTIVEPTWVAELIKGMVADKNVGIGGCKILDWSGEKIWHAGVIMADGDSFPLLRGADEIEEGQYNKNERMAAVVGTAFAIRRELLETVGLLDEDYFVYFEETDYCFRTRRAGYENMYNPKAVLIH